MASRSQTLWDLTPKDIAEWRPQIIEETDKKETSKDNDGFYIEKQNGLTCQVCSIVEFSGVAAQQSHFQTDLHWVNLKRSRKSLAPLTELPEKMTNMVEDSSSSSSSDEDDGEAEVVIKTCHESKSRKQQVYFFTQSQSLRWSLYSVVLSSNSLNEVDAKAALQQIVAKEVESIWVIILLRSGRFAAAVFLRNKVIAHKAFQRYTTRRKQGGSQSAHDSGAGKTAHSAGATLRRYNEAALKKDISELLQSWQDFIDKADTVFLGVPKLSRAMFFAGKRPMLQKNASNIRSIPFGIKRPSFAETQRVHAELSRITVSKYEVVPVSQRAPQSPKCEASIAVRAASSDLVEAEVVIPDTELVEACRSTNIELVEHLVLSHGDDSEKHAEFVNAVHPRSLTTALHQAAEQNSGAIVSMLLKFGANPCLHDAQQRVPYFMCTAKPVRDIFRRFMGLYPDRWDYASAKIPSAITDEKLEAKKLKEKDKKKKAKARKQARKKEEAEETARKLLLSQDHARKVKDGNVCDSCKVPLPLNPFTRLDYRYCSTECVQGHKRILMHEAAMKRFEK